MANTDTTQEVSEEKSLTKNTKIKAKCMKHMHECV